MLALSLTALLSFSALQVQQPAPQVATVASGQTAEVRPFYDRKTPVMVKLPADTPLEVLHQNVPWSRIKVPGGLVVWVHQDFVEMEGTVAKVKTSRLRARPLPSTGGNSHPVGKLQQGDLLQVLDQDGDWLKVLAPESLGAWVQSKQLSLLAVKPADWENRWQKAAARRRQEILAGAKPVVVVAEPEKGVVADVESNPEKPNVPAGEQSGTASTEMENIAPATAEGSATTSPRDSDSKLQSKVLKNLVVGELLKKDAAKALVQARKNLDIHAQEVTDTIDLFALPVLENCELVFTEILLHKADANSLSSARRGLTRADALRQFHRAAQEAVARRENLKEQLTSENASALANKNKKRTVIPQGGTGIYAWVGYLQYRPHQYPNTPFVVVRGKREVVLHSFDGRFYLKDFQGREIAVRGTWRETPGDSKLQVLAVEELRVLPRAGKLK